jgi:hypothetical protein
LPEGRWRKDNIDVVCDRDRTTHVARLEDACAILRLNIQTVVPTTAPQSRFLYGDGVMSLTHYRVADTGEVKQVLACFCSTTCLLLWEHPQKLGLMQ